VLASSLWLRVLVSLGFTMLVLLIRNPLANMIHQPDFARLLLLSGPLIFLMGLSEHLKNVFVGLKTVVNHFIMNLVEFSTKLALVVVLLMLVKDLKSVVNAYTFSILISVLVGLWLLYRIYRSAPPGEGEFGEFFKAVFMYSLPLSLISIGLVVMTELNTQILGVLTTEREVAIFGVGKQLTNKLPQISLALSMGTMPQFAQIEAHQREEMRRRFFKLQRTNLLIFTPIVAGLILLSPFAVPLVYGEAYRDAVLPLQILSLRLLISTTIIFTNSFLDYQGMAGKRAFNFMVSIVFDVALNLYMIPRWGAIGAAIATTLSYIPYLALNQIEVHRLFDKAMDV
jgi:O-antigen/teichoic acid export membrane protein